MEKSKKREQIYLWIIIAVTVLTVMPLMKMAMYDRQSGDDYLYAVRTYQMWNETHSLGAVIKEAFVTSGHFYNTWQGLYSSAVVQALEPGIFGDKYYGLGAMFILVMLYGANIILALTVLHRKLGSSKLSSVAFGCMLSFLMVQWMPSVLQGVYWYNGAVNYTFFYSVLTILVSVVLLLWEEHTMIRRVWNVAAAVAVGVILAGGNHVTAFAGLLFLAGNLFLAICLKQKKTAVDGVIVFAATVAGFLCNILSPGTKVRQEAFSDTPGVTETIFKAVKAGLNACDQWTGIAMIAGMLLMLPFVCKTVNRIRREMGFKFRYPLLVFVLSCGFICALLCPPIYAMGVTGDTRLINVVYFSFVVLMFVNEFYLCGFILEKMDVQREKEIETEKISKNWVITALVLAVGIAFACGERSNGYQSFLLLKQGVASQYAYEADARYDILTQSKGQDVVLTPYTVHPWLLFLDDITDDPSDWRNGYMKDYFELNSVRLE